MTIEQKHYNLKLKFVGVLLNSLISSRWNERLLEEAEIECGFAKGYSQIIFPEGLRGVIDFYENLQDQKMLELSKHESPIKIRDKIALALKVRIKDYVPKFVHLANRNYFAMPNNVLFATKMAFRTCDVIWRYAGDKSIDYNYYTKRSLLLSVYISSIIYYIQDNSENNIDTDKYIADSLAKIISIFAKFNNRLKIPSFTDIPIIRLFS